MAGARLLLAAAVLASPAAAQPSPDSATAAAGAQYAARGPLGWLATALFGAHHRDLWKAPVTAEVLRLDGARDHRAVGVASSSLLEPALALEDRAGVRWRFAPLDPRFVSGIAPLADHPAVAILLQDLVSARHPGAPLIAAALACHAGVAHPEPELRFLPDDDALGAIGDRFGGRLGWLTPEAAAAGTARLTAQGLLDSLEAGVDLPVDSLEYLESRLFDILVGEADPAAERAPWRRDPDGRWRPAPRIRWDAFPRYGGVLFLLVRPVMPEATTFKPEYPRRLGQSRAQFVLDARLRSPLPASAWDSTAHALVARLDDSTIAAAVRSLPPGWNPDGGAALEAALRARRDHLPDAARTYLAGLLDDPPRDANIRAASIRQALAWGEPRPLRGTAVSPWPDAQVHSDLGVLLAAGAAWTTWAPGHEPWQRRLRARLGYATGAEAVRLQVEAELRRAHSPLWLRLEGMASGIEVLRFHGFGNETRKDSADTDFYRAHQVQYVAGAWLGTRLAGGIEVAAGPVYQHVSTRDGANLVRQVRPYGSEDFSALGLRGAFRWDSRDSPVAARRGVLVEAGGSWYGEWFDAAEEFGDLYGRVSTYLSPREWLTFAPRLGVKRAWGRFPLHKAAFLGGHGTMRGLDPNRYAGEVAAWLNTDTRVRVGSVPFLVEWDWGVVGIADAGRVWLDGERSGRWHTGVGGGLWMALPDRSLALALSAVRSEGRLGFSGRLQFDY